MEISRFVTGFSTDMSPDIYNTLKTEQATENKDVGVPDRGYKNYMSVCPGVEVGGGKSETKCLSIMLSKTVGSLGENIMDSL